MVYPFFYCFGFVVATSLFLLFVVSSFCCFFFVVATLLLLLLVTSSLFPPCSFEFRCFLLLFLSIALTLLAGFSFTLLFFYWCFVIYHLYMSKIFLALVLVFDGFAFEFDVLLNSMHRILD